MEGDDRMKCPMCYCEVTVPSQYGHCAGCANTLADEMDDAFPELELDMDARYDAWVDDQVMQRYERGVL